MRFTCGFLKILAENYTARVELLRIHNTYLLDYPLLRLKELLIESPGVQKTEPLHFDPDIKMAASQKYHLLSA